MGEGQLNDAKILVVDDEPANIRLLERILAREGFKDVHSAAEGGSALQRLEELEPDLILVDLHMPQMDGFEVLRQLRLRSSRTHTSRCSSSPPTRVPRRNGAPSRPGRWIS